MATPIVEKPLTAEAAARRAGVAAGLAAGLVALAGGALTLNHMLPGVFYDDGLYVGIAYALSHGLGYAHPHLPGYPAAVHFPPLYPLVLAPFVGLLPLSAAVFAAKVLNIGLGAGAAVFVAALGWGLWVARHRGGIDPGMATNYGSYFEVLKGAGLGVFWPSLRELPRPLGDLTLSWLPAAALYYAFAVAALAILVYGLALMVRRSSVGLTLLCYLAILAVWPFPVDRFVWAVLPWLGLAWFAAVLRLWQASTLQRVRVPVALVAGAVAFGYVQLEARGLATRSWRAAPAYVSASAGEMLPWFATLPADAVIAADFEPLIWLNTGRLSVPFYIYGYRGREVTAPTPAEQRAYLERQGASYVMISGYVSQSVPELNALVRSYPGWLTMVKQWSGGRTVFRVNRGF